MLQATLSECKDVSSDQVQTILCLDPASKAEVNSAVSATMRDVVTRDMKKPWWRNVSWEHEERRMN